MKNSDLALFSKFVFYFSSAITLFVVIDIAKNLSDTKKLSNDTNTNTSAVKNLINDDSDLPDIYHILLDTHPGFATAKYCDENFKKELKKRGFHIYENYRSNYNLTYLSVTSLFNFDYIKKITGNTGDVYLVRNVLGYYKDNLVFKHLRNFGYDFNISMPVGFSKLFQSYTYRKNDNFLTSNFGSRILDLLFFSSLFSLFVDFNTPRYEKDVLIPFETFCGITNVKKQKHKFNYLHVLAPHIPFYTDENGVLIKKEDRFNIEGNFFGYVKFINKKTISLIDEIKSTMKENSIIILHSDHCITTRSYRHNILMAAHFPNKDDHKIIPQNGTLVNLYRCIFNRYFNGNYEMLKDKFYFLNIKDYKLVEEKQ